MKDDRIFLAHIREAISHITEYASAGHEAYMSERMRQDAIVRNFEIIGEAVKQLSESTKSRRPDIQWRQIAGMRDRLTHGYFGVDLALVWATIERDIPLLDSAINELLSDAEPQPGA